MREFRHLLIKHPWQEADLILVGLEPSCITGTSSAQYRNRRNQGGTDKTRYAVAWCPTAADALQESPSRRTYGMLDVDDFHTFKASVLTESTSLSKCPVFQRAVCPAAIWKSKGLVLRTSRSHHLKACARLQARTGSHSASNA